MIRSCLLLLLFLLFSNAIIAQNRPININALEDASLFLGGIEDPNEQFLYLSSQNRSSIRATIDTFKRFGLANGVVRQTIETQYRFDTNFNLVQFRNLSYSSVNDQLNLNREVVGVYNNQNLLTSDTTFLFDINGQKFPSTRRRILYDENWVWYEIQEERWDDTTQEWMPDTKTTEVTDGNLIKRTRSIWNGLDDYTESRIDDWYYNANGQVILHEVRNVFMGSLALTTKIARDYFENGNIISLHHYVASAPEFILVPFQRQEYTYDNLDRLSIQITSVRDTEGPDEWRYSVQNYVDYNADNTIDQGFRSTWDQSLQDWEITRRFDFSYNTLGQRTLTEEFLPISVLLDIWSLDRTTEQTIDTSYEQGSFIASSDVSALSYMITDFVAKRYRPEEELEYSHQWIYKEVESSSVIETKFYPIGIYPNPFDSNISIDLKDIQIPVSSVDIYSNSGVLCLSKPISQNTELQVAHLIPGIYILVIKGGNGEVIHSRKMIKR